MGCWVSANEYSYSHHVTWSPTKLWRSNSIFNQCCQRTTVARFVWVLWAHECQGLWQKKRIVEGGARQYWLHPPPPPSVSWYSETLNSHPFFPFEAGRNLPILAATGDGGKRIRGREHELRILFYPLYLTRTNADNYFPGDLSLQVFLIYSTTLSVVNILWQMISIIQH